MRRGLRSIPQLVRKEEITVPPMKPVLSIKVRFGKKSIEITIAVPY